MQALIYIIGKFDFEIKSISKNEAQQKSLKNMFF